MPCSWQWPQGQSSQGDFEGCHMVKTCPWWISLSGLHQSCLLPYCKYYCHIGLSWIIMNYLHVPSNMGQLLCAMDCLITSLDIWPTMFYMMLWVNGCIHMWHEWSKVAGGFATPSANNVCCFLASFWSVWLDTPFGSGLILSPPHSLWGKGFPQNVIEITTRGNLSGSPKICGFHKPKKKLATVLIRIC